jgi:sarcosine oxidase subunit gamma
MLERTSAIAVNLAAGGRDGADGRRLLAIGEVRGWHLVQLGVFAGREAEFATAVAGVLATPLPPSGVVHAPGQVRVYRIARDQYWVVGADAALADELAAVVDPAVGTVTSLSHGRVRIAIRGSAVRAMLAKLLSIDLDSDVFTVGHAQQTALQHAGVLCERSAEDRYDLYVMRTYAVSAWECMVDAALVYGYEIEEMPS